MTAPVPASPYEANRMLYAIAVGGQERDQAYKTILEIYQYRLYLHASYILHDGQEAKDIVQRVLGEKLLTQAAEFACDSQTEEFKLQAWLYRVTRNLSFNIIRDRKRRGLILEAEGINDHHVPSYDRKVFYGQRRETILDTMEDLTAVHREILILRYYEDLSYLEIADRLDIKLGTVMSRLSRARDSLEEMLEARGITLEELLAA